MLDVSGPRGAELRKCDMHTVATYLLSRLSELGIKRIFKVRGDYNLAMLEAVRPHRDIEWIDSANELDATYAADQYARVNGFGALMTPSGVGETSAISVRTADAHSTAAETHLTLANAADEIDRVFRVALQTGKPVRIVVPEEVASAAISLRHKKVVLAELVLFKTDEVDSVILSP